MRITVLMGGLSPEREVSLNSGKAVAKSLREAGHDVTALDIRGEGDDRWTPYRQVMDTPEVAAAEVVFIALHGEEGEDGTVQALLDLKKKPYTGSGVLASALAMDKVMSKRIFDLGGVPNPEWVLLSPRATESAIEAAIEPVGGIPVVTKPIDQGSTVGISIVKDAGGLMEGVEEAGRFSERVLVEKYIPGRELTVAVLGDEALPLVEIVPEGGFYDYECKYTRGKSRYVCPAEVPEGKTREIQKLARKAFDLLGCEGFARVDLRLSDEGDPYFLEINTIPGMTALSLVPMAAKAAGIDFPELVERICLLGLERKPAVEKPAHRPY
ncbi:MAG: D-alanine--D-alanine ligase [Candidatus Eisenbacteria sp.]|nr:D-alanine--D-alanine ligase [Candidatus Eisenbacteria bacterium]